MVCLAMGSGCNLLDSGTMCHFTFVCLQLINMYRGDAKIKEKTK